MSNQVQDVIHRRGAVNRIERTGSRRFRHTPPATRTLRPFASRSPRVPKRPRLPSSALPLPRSAVAKSGTTNCSQSELLGRVSFDGKYVQDLSRLILRLDLYRRQGKRIVFTNGCFDILHRGHVTYLSRAKSSGDILVLGVNSDASIQKLKGPARPINTLEDRVQVLGALSCVDHIVAFDGETACDVVRIVRPDVYVKGGDYTKDRLPEAPIVEQLGGEVRILPLVEDRSTTRIIERIRGEGDLGEADHLLPPQVA